MQSRQILRAASGIQAFVLLSRQRFELVQAYSHPCVRSFLPRRENSATWIAVPPQMSVERVAFSVRIPGMTTGMIMLFEYDRFLDLVAASMRPMTFVAHPDFLPNRETMNS